MEAPASPAHSVCKHDKEVQGVGGEERQRLLGDVALHLAAVLCRVILHNLTHCFQSDPQLTNFTHQDAFRVSHTRGPAIRQCLTFYSALFSRSLDFGA